MMRLTGNNYIRCSCGKEIKTEPHFRLHKKVCKEIDNQKWFDLMRESEIQRYHERKNLPRSKQARNAIVASGNMKIV